VIVLGNCITKLSVGSGKGARRGVAFRSPGTSIDVAENPTFRELGLRFSWSHRKGLGLGLTRDHHIADSGKTLLLS
jgi:hypothetical protein